MLGRAELSRPQQAGHAPAVPAAAPCRRHYHWLVFTLLLVPPIPTTTPTTTRVAYGKIEVFDDGVCEVDLFVQDNEGTRISDRWAPGWGLSRQAA